MKAPLEVSRSETQAVEATCFSIDSCGLEQILLLQLEHVRSNLPIHTLVRFPILAQLGFQRLQ